MTTAYFDLLVNSVTRLRFLQDRLVDPKSSPYGLYDLPVRLAVVAQPQQVPPFLETKVDVRLRVFRIRGVPVAKGRERGMALDNKFADLARRYGHADIIDDRDDVSGMSCRTALAIRRRSNPAV